MNVVIPLRLKLGLNDREHYQARGRRVKKEKLAVWAGLAGKILPPLPATITLTRIGKRRCDDDNVPGSAKACRDQIAAMYDVDDGSDQYQWKYGQEIGKEYGVRICIESIDSPAKEVRHV